MPQIHNAFSWFVDDGVFHLQRVDGVGTARASRGVFTGLAIAGGAVVVGLLTWFVISLRDPTQPPADAFLILLVVVGTLAVFSPSLVFLREAGKPHRITLAAAGLTVVTLMSRRHYPLEEVRALVVRRYRTNSRVPGGGSRLEACLESGRHTLLIDSQHSDDVTEFSPIIQFFERLKADPRSRRTTVADRVETSTSAARVSPR